MQFFSVLDADGELAREKDPHMTGNPDSDSDSEGRGGERKRGRASYEKSALRLTSWLGLSKSVFALRLAIGHWSA